MPERTGKRARRGAHNGNRQCILSERSRTARRGKFQTKFAGSNYNVPGAIAIEECGCCGAYHRQGFAGDCRDDSERFFNLQDASEKLGRLTFETAEET
jgi:hypothetical protein